MNQKKYHQEIIDYWVKKASESLDAAQDEMKAERLSFSVNRLYYACFYAVSAILFKEGFQFKKHSGVRAAFHKHFVKLKRINLDQGQLYDELFEARQRGDYIELVYFQKNQVKKWLQRVNQFLENIIILIDEGPS